MYKYTHSRSRILLTFHIKVKALKPIIYSYWNLYVQINSKEDVNKDITEILTSIYTIKELYTAQK